LSLLTPTKKKIHLQLVTRNYEGFFGNNCFKLNSLGVKEYVVSGDKAFEITLQENGGFAFII